MPKVAKIEIVIGSDGQLKYASNLVPAATVYWMEFVKMDILTRQKGLQKESNIVVPQIVPPARPEGENG